MPTVLLLNGFRFLFYSNENNEPIHIHITKANASGKIWLMPEISIAYLYGFINSEEKDIFDITISNKIEFINKWHEYFNK